MFIRVFFAIIIFSTSIISGAEVMRKIEATRYDRDRGPIFELVNYTNKDIKGRKEKKDDRFIQYQKNSVPLKVVERFASAPYSRNFKHSILMGLSKQKGYYMARVNLYKNSNIVGYGERISFIKINKTTNKILYKGIPNYDDFLVNAIYYLGKSKIFVAVTFGGDDTNGFSRVEIFSIIGGKIERMPNIGFVAACHNNVKNDCYAGKYDPLFSQASVSNNNDNYYISFYSNILPSDNSKDIVMLGKKSEFFLACQINILKD